MLKMLQKLLLTFLFVFFLILPKITLASEYLYNDEFNNFDYEKWSFNQNEGSFEIDNGIITLDSHLGSFPVMYSKFQNVFTSSGKNTLDVRFKYNSYGSMGDGISIGYTGDTIYPYYQFSLWRDLWPVFSYNDFNKAKYSYCTKFEPWKDIDDRVNVTLNNNDNDWHVLTINKINSWYQIFIDKDTNPTPIYSAYGNQCVPQNIIIGNPLSGGSTNWNSISIDYVRSYDTDNPPPTPTVIETPTPTPTPTLTPTSTPTPIPTLTPTMTPTSTPTPTPTLTPTPKRKIIIIPGLGASWNSEAMVFNTEVEDDQWKMTPFVNNYQLLIDTLKYNGLVEGQDFYVWNYDWRKPISQIVGRLDNFINKNILSGEKVVLIGHSLGGVTARLWSQNHLSDDRLDKVFSLGGPQLGAIDAYDVWNGVQIPQRDLVSNAAINLLLALQSQNQLSRLETLRSYAPVLKDLMPTFDFVKKNGVIVNINNLKSKNDYLINENKNISSLNDNYLPIVGVGVSTKEYINLGKQSIFSRLTGLWPDGDPVGYIRGNGDGTVIYKSAAFGKTPFEINSNHGEIVDKSISEIVREINLNNYGESNFKEADLSGKMLFFIGSPAYMSADCGLGVTKVSDELGFIEMSAENKPCNVKVTAIGNGGTYHLVTGKIGEEKSWQYFETEINSGESDVLILDGKTGEPIDKKNDDYWYKLLIREINQLLKKYPNNNHLKTAKESAIRKNLLMTINRVFEFRRENKEIVITNRMIDYFKELLISKYSRVDRPSTKYVWNTVSGSRKKIDTWMEMYWKLGWKPSRMMMVDYQKIGDLGEEGNEAWNSGNNASAYANSLLMSYLMERFW